MRSRAYADFAMAIASLTICPIIASAQSGHNDSPLGIRASSCSTTHTDTVPASLIGNDGHWFGAISDGLLLGQWFVVADPLQKMVYAFDETGALAWSHGGEGEGPGEYRNIGSVVNRGDTLFLHDLRLRRVTALEAHERVPRIIRLDPAPRSILIGVLPDGRLVLKTVSRSPQGIDRGLYRDTATIFVYRDRTRTLETVVSFPATERYLDHRRSFFQLPRPYGLRTGFATAGDRILVALPDSGGILGFRPSGELAGKLAVSNPRRPVTADMVREFNTRYASRTSDPAGTRAILDDIQYPRYLPPFRSLVVDQVGFLWLEQPTPPGESRYLVLSANGDVVEKFELSRDLRILDANQQWVLGETSVSEQPSVALFRRHCGEP